jgi:hypothetical protein
MPSFSGGPNYRTPFGKNVYLRSTQDVKTISKTFAASTCPTETVDGVSVKVLQPGTVISKITSGPEAGKVGPREAAGTDEIQLLTPGGTISGGTYTITVFGVTTSALAFNANAATIQAAVRAAAVQSTTPAQAAIGNLIDVTGGPISSGVVTLTFNGPEGLDVPQVTVGTGSLTGSAPTLTPSTSAAGSGGATDGRQTDANMIGVNDTFLPWQLTKRDVEIAVVYEAAVIQAQCREVNTAGQWVAMTNATATALRAMSSPKLIIF